MPNQKDNPIFRFKAAWWALGVLLLFAVLAWILRIGFPPPAPDLEELAAANRYKIRAEVDAAQKANLAWKEIEPGKTIQAPPEAVFSIAAKELLSSKPTPAKTTAPASPTSPTGPTSQTKPAGSRLMPQASCPMTNDQ
jgi:hypothetical protein